MRLTSDQVMESIPKLNEPLAKYLWLQNRRATLTDPQADVEFRDRFCKFYGVYGARRSVEWQHAYFGLMRDELQTAELSFENCLKRLYLLTRNVEASFASKLLATLDPSLPVIDEIVLGNLNLKLQRWGTPERRMERAKNVYRTLANELAECIGSAVGRQAIAAFRAAYPNAQVTDQKIVDLILWQTRTA